MIALLAMFSFNQCASNEKEIEVKEENNDADNDLELNDSNILDFTDECKNVFHSMFSEMGSVKANWKLLEMYEFEPNIKVIKKGKYHIIDNGVFLRIVYDSEDPEIFNDLSLYCDTEKMQFFPLTFYEDSVIINTETMIILPLNENSIYCGSVSYLDTNSNTQAGVWNALDPKTTED